VQLGLANKTVIVTGGASNIGRAIFLAFAGEEADAVMADLDEKQAQKVVAQAKALRVGGRAIFIKTDVTDWESVQAMVATTIKEFSKIDVLVNNVGWVSDVPFAQKPREECEKEIKINFWSVINCTKEVVPYMIERKSGKIVNIGSGAGRVGQFGEAIYGGCKAAVIAMSKTLARELGRYNINVNVVCPGAVAPEKAGDAGELSMSMARGGINQETMLPELKEKLLAGYALRRLCKPHEVASAVVFLASDAASYITGQTLSIDGGYTML
jgi:2-hydroxycyclohexanecarboxyl-CoA dehydrogenase